MIVARENTSDRLNEILNDPSIYPHVHGSLQGTLDLSGVVANPNNVLLLGEYGGVLFYQHQPGLYEAHTQVLPDGRGGWALEMVRDAGKWMFTRTDAVEIITRVAKGDIAALALTRAAGGQEIALVKDGWVRHGKTVDTRVFAMTIQQWLISSLPIADRGAWWRRLWRDSPISDDRMLGAVYEMMLNGQCAKAAILLKRWMAVVGKQMEVEVFSLSPARLRIGEVIVVVRGETNFTVLPFN